MEFKVEKESYELTENEYQIHFDTNEIVGGAKLGFTLYPLYEKDLLKLKKEIDKALKKEAKVK